MPIVVISLSTKTKFFRWNSNSNSFSFSFFFSRIFSATKHITRDKRKDSELRGVTWDPTRSHGPHLKPPIPPPPAEASVNRNCQSPAASFLAETATLARLNCPPPASFPSSSSKNFHFERGVSGRRREERVDMLGRFSFRRQVVAGEWGPPVRLIRLHEAWEALLSSKFGNVVQSARSTYLYASLFCLFLDSIVFSWARCVCFFFFNFFFSYLIGL